MRVLFPREDPSLKTQFLHTRMETVWSGHGGDRGWGRLSEDKHSLVLTLAQCGDDQISSVESET